MSNIKAIKSYQGFEEGSYAARKGRLCLIKKIHFEMHPPSVTVLMKDTDTEVGTEFDRLNHIKAWFCDICTAQNNDVNANKCSFCKMNRSFQEKIIIQDDNDQNNNHQQDNKQMEQAQESKSEDTKQSESTELSSSESEETEPNQTQQHEQDEIEEDHEYAIIDSPQDKESKYEQEVDEESESENEDEYEEEPQNQGYGYRQRPRHNGYYHDEDEYAKYQIRNRMNMHRNRNRNRNRMNRNRDPFGIGGWNAFPSFDRFFL